MNCTARVISSSTVSRRVVAVGGVTPPHDQDHGAIADVRGQSCDGKEDRWHPLRRTDLAKRTDEKPIARVSELGSATDRWTGGNAVAIIGTTATGRRFRDGPAARPSSSGPPRQWPLPGPSGGEVSVGTVSVLTNLCFTHSAICGSPFSVSSRSQLPGHMPLSCPKRNRFPTFTS